MHDILNHIFTSSSRAAVHSGVLTRGKPNREPGQGQWIQTRIYSGWLFSWEGDDDDVDDDDDETLLFREVVK